MAWYIRTKTVITIFISEMYFSSDYSLPISPSLGVVFAGCSWTEDKRPTHPVRRALENNIFRPSENSESLTALMA
jgi:hypothetical protein